MKLQTCSFTIELKSKVFPDVQWDSKNVSFSVRSTKTILQYELIGNSTSFLKSSDVADKVNIKFVVLKLFLYNSQEFRCTLQNCELHQTGWGEHHFCSTLRLASADQLRALLSPASCGFRRFLHSVRKHLWPSNCERVVYDYDGNYLYTGLYRFHCLHMYVMSVLVRLMVI